MWRKKSNSFVHAEYKLVEYLKLKNHWKSFWILIDPTKNMTLGLTGWAWTHHSLPTTKGVDVKELLRSCWSLSQLCSFEARGIPPDELAAHCSALSMGTWYFAQVYLSSVHKVPYQHTFPTVSNLRVWTLRLSSVQYRMSSHPPKGYTELPIWSPGVKSDKGFYRSTVVLYWGGRWGRNVFIYKFKAA